MQWRWSVGLSLIEPRILTEKVLSVADVPVHQPVITGVQPRYRVGNLLRGNCTSKHSRPAANLTWYINGQAVGFFLLLFYFI